MSLVHCVCEEGPDDRSRWNAPAMWSLKFEKNDRKLWNEAKMDLRSSFEGVGVSLFHHVGGFVFILWGGMTQL